MKSKRFEVLGNRPVNKDGYVKEWPEVGLIAMNSPLDPKPSIVIENGKVVELDGKKRENFDFVTLTSITDCTSVRSSGSLGNGRPMLPLYTCSLTGIAGREIRVMPLRKLTGKIGSYLCPKRSFRMVLCISFW